MNAPRSSKPVVLVPSCNRMLGQHPFHIAGRKYIEAVRLAGGLPLIVPVAHLDELDELLDLAHGVLLTGSPSNVHPRHFGEDVRDAALPLDTERDDWTLPMISRNLARKRLWLSDSSRNSSWVNAGISCDRSPEPLLISLKQAMMRNTGRTIR